MSARPSRAFCGAEIDEAVSLAPRPSLDNVVFEDFLGSWGRKLVKVASKAARFAAKEAISKAFGTGIGKHLGWQNMEIRREESGKPFVVLHDQGLTLLKERAGRIIHLSLSHTENYAAAVAVLES